jgi:hypothetical protein
MFYLCITKIHLCNTKYKIQYKIHIKNFYILKKKPGGRVDFKILCYKNLKIFFARPKVEGLVVTLYLCYGISGYML